jgi:outer membrane receptor protein involved in Fe transport
MMEKSLPIVACMSLVCLSLVVRASAQVNTASLTGLITDQTGAAVADAQVTAKNKATNVETSVTTDSSGYYTFASLPAGTYMLVVESKGFKKAIRESVDLDVGQKARIDFTLEVGAVTESVMIEASAPLLTTQEASTGAVIENKIITDLPLSLRNWDDLLSLVAGVQSDRYTEEGGGTAAGRTGGANVHGVRSLQNNFVLDGVDNNSISTNVQELTTQVARPSVDSINEFKVTTNPYSAENGRSPGSLISVTTKSGSNSFRGTLYEFHRNRIFDANNFFLNRAGRPKGQHVQNQFGGNLGGPIIKNHAFFFFNYEGTRIRKGTTRLGNVPMPNERIGDFSAAAAAANRTTYDRLIDRVGDCVGKGNPFPDNKIPARCLDPIAVKVLSLLPLPNLVPGSGPVNVNNFIRVPNIEDDTDSYTARGDWQVNANNSAFVRWTYSNRFRFVPGVFGGIIDGTGTSAFGRLSMKAQSAAIGWNRTIGARMVNEFRMGWGRNVSRGAQDPFGKNTLAEFGIKGVPDNPVYSGGLPGLVIQARGGVPNPGDGSGLDRLGSPDFLPKFQITNQFQWTDTLSLARGAHQIKLGVDLRAPMRNIYLDVPGLRGSWTFDGQRTGIGLADFLLGYPSAAQLSNLAIVDQRLRMVSGFFQDDWKVTPKLTLNLGLRYDLATWPYEGADRMTNFDPKTGKTFTTANSPFGRSLVKSDKKNFAPRIGIAWQITPNTVVRTGYGRFYMLFERAGSEDQLALNLPWFVNNVVSATSTSSTANDMRVRTGFNLSLNPSAVNPVTVRVRAVNPEAVHPSLDQWNLGIQRLLPGDILMTIDYVGTKGTHLSVLRNLNQQFFNPDGTGTGIIPYPAFGPIEYRDNMGNSNYHGGELTIEKRFSRGFSFHGAYTFSKSIDYAMEHLFSGGSNSFMQNAHDIRQQRGRSDFDYRHRFVVGYIWELPFGRGRSFLSEGALSHILGGWRVSGLTNVRSGRPFTIFASANNNLVGNRGGLANAVADCLRNGALPRDQRTVDRWFDPTAYSVPTPARLGNCGRNILDGPGLTNFDFALSRSFEYFGEGRRLEFRWEMFNMFNTPQFGLPERNLSSSAVGRISTLAGDPRVMQFALKFNF